MTLIAFECERCAAALKVRPMLAGRSIQCPKCGRKTAVPAPSSGEGLDTRDPAAVPDRMADAVSVVSNDDPDEPAYAVELLEPDEPPPAEAPVPPPVNVPVPPPAAVKVPVQVRVPVPPPVRVPVPPPAAVSAPPPVSVPVPPPAAVSAPPPVSVPVPPPVSVQAPVQAVVPPPTRAAEAAVRSEADGRLESELSAVRKRAEDLERKLAVAQDQLRLAREAIAAGTALPSAAVSFEDNAQAEEALAPLHTVSFPKILRTAVLIHVVVLLGTSAGYFYRLWKDKHPVAEPVAEQPAGEAQKKAPEGSAPAEPGPESAKAPSTSPQPPATVETVAPVAPVTPVRPKSELEQRIESLPEPGERPTASSVSLDL